MAGRAGPSARPKRAGDDFLRTHHAEDPEPASKKLRFDARNPSQLVAEADDDGEDAVLELDSIGKGPGTKRSGVNLDGYDSDSDNDNFDARAADRAKAQKRAQKQQDDDDDDDDDDDMFAELEDEVNGGDDDDPDLQKKKKKAVRFMDETEIEGQDFASKEGSNVFDLRDTKGTRRDVKEDSDDSESGGDEGRDAIASDDDAFELGAGSKKKHAPLLDAFNMKAEGEEGRFDETGNFVRRADPNAIHDAWLEGVSKKEMRKAREAEELREADRRKKAMERDAILASDLLSTLITHLQPGETVLEALGRLGKGKQKQKPKWQKNRKQNGNTDSMDVDVVKTEDPAEVKRKQDVDALTVAADELLSRGQEEVYDTERELLMRQYQRETGENWKDVPNHDADDEEDDETAQYHYRWADARDGGTHHGPYDVPTMRAWNDAGYFGEGVEFQKVGTDDWSPIASFV